MLTSSDLIARLRSGVHAEPAALEIDWRSRYIDPPVTETGFDPGSGGDAAIDASALSGTYLLVCLYEGIPPNRPQYTIHPIPTPKENPHV